MTAYIIRRLTILPITLLGLSLLVFGMLQFLSPLERVALYIPDTPRNPADIQEVIEKYGLDDPIYVQYADWIGNVLSGNLGWSKTAQQPVLGAIGTYLPATVELALVSFVPIMVLGVWLGVRAAVNHGRFFDHAARIFSILGYSFPTFVFALLLIMVFYAGLQWFPPGRLSDWADIVVYSSEFRRYTGMNTVDGLLNGRMDIFIDSVRHLVLPALTLAYVNCAFILRLVRSSMLEALRQDYTNTARAKGLPERHVINRHARRNALLPVATVGGLLLAGLLNGAGIAEIIFNYHGLGWWAVKSALNYDAISVLGFTMFNATLLVLANLAVDMLYLALDPRIRLA